MTQLAKTLKNRGHEVIDVHAARQLKGGGSMWAIPLSRPPRDTGGGTIGNGNPPNLELVGF